mmetsp:Transcript_14105/g.21538  ORF Transcript_14105/g.21538 Transcript_14105/m.21538 type:complete len:106 (-) Transcript_14105:279-596(-)|eukprot:CAMPEP_0178920552 /NCGR_PEP_ID=MMETSP0786-20121207/15067_1 /TAXON_ID=186022 /ORGANISM="Thalassionema frauenfeldii, Strain CCMP 1798" /LENGTH=105 /DNA_ID=CAMNT_0020594629 /DNA_START=134 /DNA_END=451 /DNA_ORIENTATION=-
MDDSYQKCMRRLLGKTLKCTLDDGRTATGKLICVDRLKNLILGHVVEERMVDSSFYCDEEYTAANGSKMIVTKRELTQAMIPGIHLVKVEVERSTYEEDIEPILG